MSRPKMIGAHVPRPPAKRARRCQLNESAEMINRAYDEHFVRGRDRSHLVYRPRLEGPRS